VEAEREAVLLLLAFVLLLLTSRLPEPGAAKIPSKSALVATEFRLIDPLPDDVTLDVC